MLKRLYDYICNLPPSAKAKKFLEGERPPVYYYASGCSDNTKELLGKLRSGRIKSHSLADHIVD